MISAAGKTHVFRFSDSRARISEFPSYLPARLAYNLGDVAICRQLAALFLCTPIMWSGRVLQTVGRAMRPAPGKSAARIIDFVDINEPVLAASYHTRVRTLKSLKA